MRTALERLRLDLSAVDLDNLKHICNSFEARLTTYIFDRAVVPFLTSLVPANPPSWRTARTPTR
jgi:hypothetical protein